MRLLLGTGLATLIVLSSTTASAVEDDLPVANETPRFVPIVVGDGYYAYHDPPPPGRSATLATTAARHNEFAVNLLAIGGRLEHAKLTGTVVLQAGTSVDALYATQPSSLRDSAEVWKHIQLANVGWKAGDLHVELGAMPSGLGREGFVSTDDWNYTRTVIADSTPYFVTGARATYRLAPTWSVAATVFNGWDQHGDRNKQKSAMVRLAWEPSDKLSVAYTSVAGSEQASREGVPTSYRLFNDLVASYKLHARVQIALEAWLGSERRLQVEDRRKGDVQNAFVATHPLSYGGALWARWQFADTTYIALRAEGVSDRYGVITGRGARADQEPAPGQRIGVGTVTVGWQPHPKFLTRVEAMHRLADQPFFVGGDPQTYEESLGETGGRASFVTAARRASTTFVISAAFFL